MKIRMKRTAVGTIAGVHVNYQQGRTYEGVDPRVANMLHAADACDWAGMPPSDEPNGDVAKALEAGAQVEAAVAEPEAEDAEAPKPRKRRGRKRKAEPEDD